MLKKQENIIICFFIVVLLSVGIYAVISRSIVDVIYLVVVGFYFGRFLVKMFRR